MNKFATELIKRKVILKRERAIVGVISDIVIDPANGNFVGILIQEEFGKNAIKALAEKDIVAFGLDFILISEYSALGEINEIVRIQNIINTKTRILKNKVYTETGVYLGKVYDFTLDIDNKRLSRLYVKHPFFLQGGFLENKIIPYVQIVSIDKKKIVVADAKVEKRAKSAPKIFKLEQDEVTPN